MNYRISVILLLINFYITPSFAQIRGNATYYSKRSNKRRLSDGSIYHKDSMICAHKKYPIGTLLKVTNPKNGNEVFVRVADRGPFGKNRIIDLSYGAAQKLDIIKQGVALVEIEVVNTIPYLSKENNTVNLEIETFDDSYYFIPQWQNIPISEKKLPNKIKIRKKENAIKQYRKNGKRRKK